MEDSYTYIRPFHKCQGCANVTLSLFCLKICSIVISSSFTKNETEINMFRYSGTNQGFWVKLYRPKMSVSTRDISLWVIDYDFDAKPNEIFSDYDLSLICSSRCDDEFIKCISSCSISYAATLMSTYALRFDWNL